MVSSTKGIGSEFTFQIPIQKIVIDNTDKPVSTTYDENIDLTGRRLLMVEDHHLNAKINMKINQAVKDSGLLAVLEKPLSIEQAEIVLKQCLAETSP